MHLRPASPTDAEPTAPIAVVTPASAAEDPAARADGTLDDPAGLTTSPAPARTPRRTDRHRTYLVRQVAVAHQTGAAVRRPGRAEQTDAVHRPGPTHRPGTGQHTEAVRPAGPAQQAGAVRRARVVRVLLAVVAAVAVSGGCAISVDSGSGGNSGGGSSSDNPINSVNRDDLDQDEQSAVDATTAYWRQVLPEDFRRTYVPPQVKGGYLGEDGPTCGGQPSVPFNAFYCPSQDFLAWDQNLMAAGYRQIGDAWVYLIIAHEWGHAIQARLRADQVSVAAELQADCFAGATLFGAADRGLLTFERGDIEELQQTLVAVADDFPWTKESDHGDARQRINAFNQGAQGGVTSCVN